jgi:hypothetical protein
MAETTQIMFSFKEVAEALIKKQGIHDGVWGIFVRFGIQATNAGPDKSQLLPTAIVPIIELGLQKFDEENNLAVDASKVNPEGLPLGEPVKK